MSNGLPLLAHPTPATPFAHRPEGVITAGQFLADVFGLAALLPAGQHVLNVCTDRYRFAVGLAASLVSGKISLLPSTHTPETVAQLLAMAPDVFCLTDHAKERIALPQLHFPHDHFPGGDGPYVVPQIDPEQTVAEVFTSGSTGLPVPHRKTWGRLVGSMMATARQLGVAEVPCHLVGTVPAQHMYGLESTVLLPLLTGGSFWAGRPFFPADISAALAAMPQPRALVSTPVHLRTLIDAGDDGLALPRTDLILSATAPLSIELARRVETALGGTLKEIYGCTETGQLATRRPSASPEWQRLAGIRFDQDGDTTTASGPFIDGRISLGDVLELTAGDRFILHGRHADLINIAGKRTSLAYLNHQLTAIPGVVDGAFFVPDDEAVDGVTRLCACVVAPGIDRTTIDRALRQRIDPIFLPRPLHLVEALPRNATGKLPRPALREFISRLNTTAAADSSAGTRS